MGPTIGQVLEDTSDLDIMDRQGLEFALHVRGSNTLFDSDQVQNYHGTARAGPALRQSL